MNDCRARSTCPTPCGTAVNSGGYEIQALLIRDGWTNTLFDGKKLKWPKVFPDRCSAQEHLDTMTLTSKALNPKKPKGVLEYRVYEVLHET